jgi:hypothetical protein
MSSTQTVALRALQSRPGDLAQLNRNLARLLVEQGLNSTQASEVFARHVTARCAVCGLSLTGEELGAWAVLDPDAKPADARLARLRLGYCGRLGCESWCYNLEVTDYPGVDWARVLEQAASAPSPTTRTARPRLRLLLALLRRFEAKTYIRLGLGLAMVLALLFIRYRSNGGRIPLLEPKHQYLLNPSSDTRPPGGR